MVSGGSGAWRSRGSRDAMPNPVSLTSPFAPIHQDIGRLDVLVDEATLVRLAHRGDDADGEAQEASHLHGRAEQPLERLAARIFEHQHGPTAIARKLQRTHGPRTIQLILQSIFVGEAFEARG